MQNKKNFLKVLNGQKTDRVPFWFMRQAGRYLPEYMILREQAGSFLNMAYNPGLASEITLQPIRRFGMNAAIIFSDILVVPHALGQDLSFLHGEGPKLGELSIDRLSDKNFHAHLTPVYEALSLTREGLKKEGFDQTALIGFCGAPWTVATYMIEGGSSKDYVKTKTMMYKEPEKFAALMNILIESTASYLIKQVDAGAEALQIFDSWAGALDSMQFVRWVIEPTRRIVEIIRKTHKNVPIIGFPRCAGMNYEAYARQTGVTALGLDHQVDTALAAKMLQPILPVQGNLDPMCLLAGGEALEMAARKILDDLSGGPFIFNLGHGINKETPIEHVESLVKIINSHKI